MRNVKLGSVNEYYVTNPVQESGVLPKQPETYTKFKSSLNLLLHLLTLTIWTKKYLI